MKSLTFGLLIDRSVLLRSCKSNLALNISPPVCILLWHYLMEPKLADENGLK